MINNMSNRTYAWLMATLIGSIVALALVITHMQDLVAAWLWIRWILALIAAILSLFALYLLWHHVHTRHLARHQKKTEIKLLKANYEDEKWRAEQSLLHAQEMERARLEIEREKARTEQIKARLEHERLMFAARIQAQHITVPGGHGLYVREETGYQMLQAPHVPSTPKLLGEAPAPLHIPDPHDFAEVLQTFTPSDQGIYIATGISAPIITPMYDLTHVGMGGHTGGGKTNGTRLITGQLLYAGASVYLATPSLAQVKYNGYRLEDWRPIIQRLKEPPAREPEQMKSLLERFLALFEDRKQKEDITPRRSKDVFLVLGELPGITKRLKKIKYDGIEVIDLLLREARQYGVHVVTEFQDILVKTTGLDSGVRENLLTGIYYGGDPRTAKVLLDLKDGEKIEEGGLGDRGASYVKVKAVRAQPARVPFFSNRALYQLLGEPPDPMPDHEIYDEEDIPEFYYQMVNGRYVDAHSTIEMERDDADFQSRLTPRQTGPLDLENTSPESRLEIGMEPLADKSDATSDARPGYPMMDEIQAAQFLAGYRIKRDIDFNLRKIKLGSGYRQHARVLIQQHGLQGE